MYRLTEYDTNSYKVTRYMETANFNLAFKMARLWNKLKPNHYMIGIYQI